MKLKLNLWSALVAALSNVALSVPSAQFQMPRISQDEEPSFLKGGRTVPYRDDLKSLAEPLSLAERTKFLQMALRAVLELEDPNASAGANGISEPPKISRTTALFLLDIKNRYQEIQDLLEPFQMKRGPTTTIMTEALEGNLKEQEASLETDNLFEALMQLSESLERKPYLNGKKREKKHKRHSYHSSNQETHFRYWLRSGNCPNSSDGLPKVFCPSPSEAGEWQCVDTQQLCDGQPNCPGNEDEHPQSCLFYKAIHSYLDFLTSAVLNSMRRHHSPY